MIAFNQHTPLEVRFWAKVEKSDGCWMWVGRIDQTNGYGRFKTAKGEQGAHRVAYELTHGDVSYDLTTDHLCRVKTCVNPDHLEPVTPGENARRYTRTITHCPKGHPYDEINTRWESNGVKRNCRTCERERPTRDRRKK